MVLRQGALPTGSQAETTNSFPSHGPTAANSSNAQAHQPGLASSQSPGRKSLGIHYQLPRDTACKAHTKLLIRDKPKLLFFFFLLHYFSIWPSNRCWYCSTTMLIRSNLRLNLVVYFVVFVFFLFFFSSSLLGEKSHFHSLIGLTVAANCKDSSSEKKGIDGGGCSKSCI